MGRKLISIDVGMGVSDPSPVILEVPVDWKYKTLYQNWSAGNKKETFADFVRRCGGRDPVTFKLEHWGPE